MTTKITDAQRVKALAFARAQKGKQYVFAATGPNTFDCSGLTMVAWRHAAGLQLAHFAATQAETLHAVDRNAANVRKLKIGDLLFLEGHPEHGNVYGPGGGYGHVMMYSGHGMAVHASAPNIFGPGRGIGEMPMDRFGRVQALGYVGHR